jgi:hypothetical protein
MLGGQTQSPVLGGRLGRRVFDSRHGADDLLEMLRLCEKPKNREMTRREMLGTVGKAAAVTVVLPPFLHGCQEAGAPAASAPDGLAALAGPDRVVVLPGKTYINSWAGYGLPPSQRPRRRRDEPEPPTPPTGPEPTVTWSKESGPGTVEFAEANALVTTATFSAPGAYVLKLTAAHGSWLNIAEIELSVLVRQCLDRRIDTLQEIRTETRAWQTRRDHAESRIDWQFTYNDARIKLKRLYPTLDG